jgi:hypothetical protein
MMAPSLCLLLKHRVLSAKYNRPAGVLRIELQNFHQRGEIGVYVERGCIVARGRCHWRLLSVPVRMGLRPYD